MCLAICAPVGVQLSRDRLSNGWDSNSDGGGYAFIDQYGGIVCRRFMSWFEFIEGYTADHAANTKSPFIVHQRFATHGTTDLTNVHPFWMDDETVVMHNGVLGVNLTDQERSDTRHFVEDYLARLPKRWFDDQNMVDMVEDYTRGSKLVLLTVDPLAKQEVYILNEDAGHWDKGAWWSNYSYRETKYHGWGTTTVKAGATTKAPAKSAKESAKVFSSTVAADGTVTSQWVDDPDAPPIPAPFDDDDYRWGDRECEFCGLDTHEKGVCFTCEFCGECNQFLWSCAHVNDRVIVDSYMYWLQTQEMLEEIDEVLGEDEDDTPATQLEVVTDPEAVRRIADRVMRP